MLFRSTGLGKSELIADITGIKRQGDYIIMEMQTSEPVRWKIRGGVDHKDMLKLFGQLLKLSVFPFFLNPVGWFKKTAEHPGDF